MKNKREKKTDYMYRQPSFYDIDEPLRKHFISQYAIALIIAAAGIILAIGYHSLFFLLSFFLIAVLTATLITNTVMLCFENKMLYYEGECIDIITEKLRRPCVTISMKNGMYVKFYIPDAKKKNIEIGSIVGIYTSFAIPQMLNDDTISIPTCTYIYCKRNRIAEKE